MIDDVSGNGYSLPTQREACKRKIKDELKAVFVGEYIDKDTGTC
jgi:hypothetical protein